MVDANCIREDQATTFQEHFLSLLVSNNLISIHGSKYFILNVILKKKRAEDELGNQMPSPPLSEPDCHYQLIGTCDATVGVRSSTRATTSACQHSHFISVSSAGILMPGKVNIDLSGKELVQILAHQDEFWREGDAFS